MTSSRVICASCFRRAIGTFEARFELAQFLFVCGDVSRAAELFEHIDKRAPASFRPRRLGETMSLLTGLGSTQAICATKTGSYSLCNRAHIQGIFFLTNLPSLGATLNTSHTETMLIFGFDLTIRDQWRLKFESIDSDVVFEGKYDFGSLRGMP